MSTATEERALVRSALADKPYPRTRYRCAGGHEVLARTKEPLSACPARVHGRPCPHELKRTR